MTAPLRLRFFASSSRTSAGCTVVASGNPLASTAVAFVAATPGSIGYVSSTVALPDSVRPITVLE